MNFEVKNAFYKLKKIRRILLVGAPGFEPGTSCAQGRRATRLRYAPTVTALFILKHISTLLLIPVFILASLCQNCPQCFY